MAKKAPPRAYPPEFRHKILELHRAGRSLNSLAQEFEVARQTIMNWSKQSDLDTGQREDGLTTVERTELTLLRRENKRLSSSKTYCQKPRPGSHERQTRFQRSLRIRESAPGRLFRDHALPRSRSIR